MGEIYLRFIPENIKKSCVIDEENRLSMYLYESKGEGRMDIGIFNQGKVNGYYLGKKWMDWHISEWKQGFRNRVLFKKELKGEYPNWFLKKYVF